MPAYMIADLRVKDAEKAAEYRKAVVPLIKKHAGIYRARGGEARSLEGDWSPDRLVIIEFPSMEAAQAFYDDPDYEPVKKLRMESSDGSMVIVQGLDTPI